jgi:hypothetical protein
MPGEKIRSPSLSFRKLDLRAIDTPLHALARWLISVFDSRQSKITGTLWVLTLRGLSLRTARSPARWPIASGASRSLPCKAEE